MFRLARIPSLAGALVVGAAMLATTAPAASAAPAVVRDADLGALWTTILETPTAQNPFGSGGAAFSCVKIGNNTIAPIGPNGVKSCTVKEGTLIFEAANSAECSTFEGNGTTEEQLRTCAENADVKTAPAVTLDGKPVTITEAESDLLHITLPARNLFSLPAGTTGLSVAHGWIAHLGSLAPGTHMIVGSGSATFNTRIIVSRG